jgi:hypothetical protein
MFAEKEKKGEFVISAILRKFIHLLLEIFLLAILLSALGFPFIISYNDTFNPSKRLQY